MRIRLLCSLLLALSPLVDARAGWFERTWPDTHRDIESEFPNVRHITTSELAEVIDIGSAKAPLLLDIRAPAEYRVSHLAGAMLASDEKAALAAVLDRDKRERIVVYCSVGWRSSDIAQALQRAGYRDVRNLKGGIFAWANEGRPVYRGDRRVITVHPFDRDWGRLLAPRYRAKPR